MYEPEKFTHKKLEGCLSISLEKDKKTWFLKLLQDGKEFRSFLKDIYAPIFVKWLCRVFVFFLSLFCFSLRMYPWLAWSSFLTRLAWKVQICMNACNLRNKSILHCPSILGLNTGSLICDVQMNIINMEHFV